MIIDELIFDRSQADVDYAIMLEKENIYTAQNLKGAYNFSDKNRVGNAVNYIGEILRKFNYNFNEICRTNYKEGEIITIEDNEKLLKLLNDLNNIFPVSAGEIPSNLDALDYNKANKIEQFLFELWGIYERLAGSCIYAGDAWVADYGIEDQRFDGYPIWNG